MAFTWRYRSLSGLILLVLVFALTACLGGRQEPPPPLGAAVPVKTAANPADVPRMTPQDLHSRLETGEDIIVVDARASEAYGEQHIEGSISVPVAEIESRHQELPKDKEIVFYCT